MARESLSITMYLDRVGGFVEILVHENEVLVAAFAGGRFDMWNRLIELAMESGWSGPSGAKRNARRKTKKV